MEINIEHYDKFLTLETASEKFDDVLDDLLGCMMAMGFTPETIKDSILKKAEELGDSKNNPLDELNKMWGS